MPTPSNSESFGSTKTPQFFWSKTLRNHDVWDDLKQTISAIERKRRLFCVHCASSRGLSALFISRCFSSRFVLDLWCRCRCEAYLGSICTSPPASASLIYCIGASTKETKRSIFLKWWTPFESAVRYSLLSVRSTLLIWRRHKMTTFSVKHRFSNFSKLEIVQCTSWHHVPCRVLLGIRVSE